TMNMQIVRNPGLLTIDTDPPGKSEGSGFNFTVIPQALTFTIVLRENLKLGIGLFNSSVRREFVTEQVTSPPGITPDVRSFSGRNSKVDLFHISSGLAGEFGKRQKVLFGGAFDIVIANARIDDSYTVFYDGGVAGQVSSGEVRTQTGFGFQLKAGIQWVPIPKVRIGLSIASPSYVFALLERSATHYNQAPPAGTAYDENDPNRQLAEGSESRGGRGGWWGIDPGNIRFGVAYVGSWGWVEGDLVYDLVYNWRLREEELRINLRGFINGRVGAAFRVTKSIKLGVGAFTDFSQVDQLARLPLATQDINFFGVHLGVLYSTREVHPDKQSAEEEEGVGFSIAVGLRYAYGKGDTLGLLIPAQYDPSNIINNPVPTTVHEIGITFATKVAF
ncbi:MAG: hypothetical protein JRE73_17105, partial [Deltaproteobacteria bacterium]|nr:hypothetical protein [Deltaproteobacteria bacterium]